MIRLKHYRISQLRNKQRDRQSNLPRFEISKIRPGSDRAADDRPIDDQDEHGPDDGDSEEATTHGRTIGGEGAEWASVARALA